MRGGLVAIVVFSCILIGCTSFVFHADPLNSLVAEVRDSHGYKVEFFDLDNDPQKTFIGRAHFFGPRGEERFAEFDRAGNLRKSYSADGSFVEFDWSNPSLTTITVGTVIDGSLVTETRSYAREAVPPSDGSLAFASQRSLVDPIQPTSVTVRVSACPSTPTLRDVQGVFLNMNYGPGRSGWTMNKVSDGVYSLR